MSLNANNKCALLIHGCLTFINMQHMKMKKLSETSGNLEGVKTFTYHVTKRFLNEAHCMLRIIEIRNRTTYKVNISSW